MKIKVLYEDKNVVVIDKPAMVSVHSDGKTKEKTISDWVLKMYPETENVGEPMRIEYGGEKIEIKRPGIVHRLDKETSGALIIARNQKTFNILKEQFQDHKIKKIYRAFVYDFVKTPDASLLTGKRGVIDVPIGRSPKDIRAWTAGRGAKGPLRDATTEYSVIKNFSDVEDEKPQVEHRFSYIEAYPKTGRTHQIRVHMRYINHPVVSDPIYRGAKEKALGMDRLALHAYSITFRLPNGDLKTVEAPLPADFKKVIKTYIQ